MSRSIFYIFSAFSSLLVIFCIIKLNNKEDLSYTFAEPPISEISPKEFYDSFKPKELMEQCLNNSEKIINKSQEILINAYKQKYISCTFDEIGGLGYQIWRFASLYGLGRDTNRLPYFEGQNLEQMISLKELGTIFPMMPEILQIKNPSNEIVKHINYGGENSEYEYFTRLFNFSEKYLKIQGNYLQSYKYFHRYQNEIRNILKCGPTIQTSLNFYTKQIFGNDSNFKICAHIRRGNFLRNSMLESTENFIIPVLDYAKQYFKNKNKGDISLILIGDDQSFMKNLTIPNIFNKIYIPKSQSRGKDICLGINYCDSMILTASGSAFGWWMSYLMKPNSTIFYNSKIGDNGNSYKDIYDFDLFPEEWIKITVINGKAQREEKWWRQRHG